MESFLDGVCAFAGVALMLVGLVGALCCIAVLVQLTWVMLFR